MEVRLQECAAGLDVRGDALEEGERVADAVAIVGGHDDGRDEEGICGDDFLEEHSDEADRVPEENG